jgi:ribonuclease-3 family protein
MTDACVKLSPLALAYLGDAVYELAVREYLLRQGQIYNKQLHQKTVELVRADCQSRLYDSLTELLDEQEKAVMRQGRNAKSGHQPPHTSVAAYRRATGVESLIGWLYLEGKKERLDQIFEHLFAENIKE